MKKIILPLAILCILVQCSTSKPQQNVALQKEVDTYLTNYNKEYQKVLYASSLAAWDANINITDENDAKSVVAEKAYAEFVGKAEAITKTKSFLAQKNELIDLQVRQLEEIISNASSYPGTIPDVVNALIEAGQKQSSDMYGFEFSIDKNGKKEVLTTNQIDNILKKSTDLQERLAVWQASKEVGKPLKKGLENLALLRNKVGREMGYTSYFNASTQNYGMSSKEMLTLMDKLINDLKPLYIELHTFARYELAKKYNQPVPDLLPAHWLGNRWGQEWPGLVDAIDMDAGFKDKTPEWIVKHAEDFYTSIGFPKLNDTFWQKSDLYPPAAGDTRKKNNHASAWHLDNDQDYRSLMSVEPNFEWFGTTHHELGHIYYYIAYSNPNVPLLLRNGANPAFHEGIGSLITLASGQEPYLRQKGLIGNEVKIDKAHYLLNQAFQEVVFLPFGAGTMTHFEHDLYETNLPMDQYNKTWWTYAKKYQGIVPPTERGEEYADAATKTHINDDPASYYDYVISTVLYYQLHDHIAKKILKQDPTNSNYYGNKEAGKFLWSILEKGKTVDWRQLMKETTGEDINAKAMLDYYKPLMEYLQKANEGRQKSVF